jgi:hypothetical protein
MEKLGPEIGPQLQRTQPNSLDRIDVHRQARPVGRFPAELLIRRSLVRIQPGALTNGLRSPKLPLVMEVSCWE